MQVTSPSAKGQVVIPKAVQEVLGLQPQTLRNGWQRLAEQPLHLQPEPRGRVALDFSGLQLLDPILLALQSVDMQLFVLQVYDPVLRDSG